MENLTKALDGKKLEDLTTLNAQVETHIIEPTKAEVNQILTLLKEGKTYKEIKKEVRRVEMEERERTIQVPTEVEKTRIVNNEEEIYTETVMVDEIEKYQYQVSAKGFSYGQIKEVDMGREAKIVELTPVVEEEVLPKAK